MNNREAFGIIGLVVFLFAALALLVGPAIYGLILAFKASIILGVFAMVLEPSPAIIGWLAIIGRTDLCEKLAAWLHLPF